MMAAQVTPSNRIRLPPLSGTTRAAAPTVPQLPGSSSPVVVAQVTTSPMERPERTVIDAAPVGSFSSTLPGAVAQHNVGDVSDDKYSQLTEATSSTATAEVIGIASTANAAQFCLATRNAAHGAGALGHRPDADPSLRRLRSGEISLSKYLIAAKKRAAHGFHMESAAHFDCIYCKQRFMLPRFPRLANIYLPPPCDESLKAKFIRDNTRLPSDGQGKTMYPGTRYVQSYLLKNMSDEAWPQFKATQVDGPSVGREIVFDRHVAPGAEFVVDIPMTTPATPGNHVTLWKIAAGGRIANFILWSAIVISDDVLKHNSLAGIEHVPRIVIEEFLEEANQAAPRLLDHSRRFRASTSQTMRDMTQTVDLGEGVCDNFHKHALPPVLRRPSAPRRSSAPRRHSRNTSV